MVGDDDRANAERFKVPAKERLSMSTLALCVLLFLFTDIADAVFALVAVGIALASAFAPDLPFSIQADFRRAAIAASYNKFIDVLTAGRIIDAQTRREDISLECLEAPEPDIFIFSTSQVGKTEGDIKRIVNSSLLAFNATGVSVEPVRNARRGNATFRITYFSDDEMARLRDMRVSLSDLDGDG